MIWQGGGCKDYEVIKRRNRWERERSIDVFVKAM